jgi:homoserine O-acetyltransferase
MKPVRFAHSPPEAGHLDAPHRVAYLGDLVLESGAVIHDFHQSYVIHGDLDQGRSEVVLVCASLAGNHHRLDFLIGPGKALDPERFCVVATDPIGNGLSTSPSSSVRQHGMRFPDFCLRDMVHAQYRLMTEHLRVEAMHAVVGASMGGMQALQWAVSHPRFLRNCVAMTPMARTAPWAALVTEAARACLTADPAWDGSAFQGVPERGWRAWTGLMSALLSRTPAALEDLALEPEGVRNWLDGLVARNRTLGFDATDYLYQSRAYAAHDVGSTPGLAGTAAALARVEARVLVMAPPLDLFNPAGDARKAAVGIPGAVFVEIPSSEGHQSASGTRSTDAAFLNQIIARFL